MARKRYTAEEIIGHLRTIDIETGKGLGIAEACRKLSLTEQTYYRWRKKYGGLRVDQAKRLKRLVADLSFDNSILKEVAAGNGYARPDAEKRSAGCGRRWRCRNAGRVASWGHAGPRSSMGPCAPTRRTPCGRGSSRWLVNMGGMGTDGSRPSSSRKAGESPTNASSESGGRKDSRCRRSSPNERGCGWQMACVSDSARSI